MKFKLLLLVFLIQQYNTLYAQSGFFEAGFIIQNGETTQGLIERTGELEMSKSINFKAASEADKLVNFVPKVIDGFGFHKDSLYFEVVEAEIRNGNEISNVSRFAKLLLRGYVNLYKLSLPPGEQQVILEYDNTYIYVVRKEGKDYTLGQYEYKVDNRVRMNRRYIGVLKAVLTGCPDSGHTFDNLKFEDKPMIRVVSAYNVCTRPDIPTSHVAYEVKKVIKHGPEVSYGKFFSPHVNLVGSSHCFSVGYFWDILDPDISQRNSLKLGLYYNMKRFTTSRYYVERSYSSAHLSFPLLAQFSLAKTSDAAYSPFLNAGMTGEVGRYNGFVDYATYISVGGGFYTPKYRIAVMLDNEQLKLKSARILSLTIGYRLDK